jgi:putative transposase
MHAALRAEGRTASRGRVARLMRRHGIRALAGRRFRPCTTDSRHHLPIAPNLLKRAFGRHGTEPHLAGRHHLYRNW